MPTETDLTGLGMNPFLSGALGYQPSSIVGIGTTQVGAPTCTSKNVTINAQTGQTAVTISKGAKQGTPQFFTNATISNASALVYVPSGHTLNGGAAGQGLNGCVTIAQNTTAILFQSGLHLWYSK